jgi:alkylation response protein AidB-like acyl-CoA dehydrogenase
MQRPRSWRSASDYDGVQRSADLDLMALRSSNTAAVKLKNVHIDASDVIHADARQYLPAVRPSFLGMQCGMSIGLARASLRAALALSSGGAGSPRGPLSDRIEELQKTLEQTVTELLEGVYDGRFKTNAPLDMFRIRLSLAEIVQQAVMLELQAKRRSCVSAGWRQEFCAPLARGGLRADRHAKPDAIADRIAETRRAQAA